MDHSPNLIAPRFSVALLLSLILLAASNGATALALDFALPGSAIADPVVVTASRIHPFGSPLSFQKRYSSHI